LWKSNPTFLLLCLDLQATIQPMQVEKYTD